MTAVKKISSYGSIQMTMNFELDMPCQTRPGVRENFPSGNQY